MALRQWLAKLVHVIAATESTSAHADVEGVAVCVGSSSLLLSESTLGPHLLNPNSCWALPEIIVQLMPVHAGRMRCAEEEGAVVEGDMQSGTCVHQHHGQYAGMPTFPRAMQQRSVHASAAAAADCNTISTPPQTCDRSQASGTSDTLHQSASGRQLLIVTGWGRRARWGQSQGESKVKQAVAAELQRLRLPFRQVKQGGVSGRWELGEGELRLWLQRNGGERVVELLRLEDGRWEEGRCV